MFVYMIEHVCNVDYIHDWLFDYNIDYILDCNVDLHVDCSIKQIIWKLHVYIVLEQKLIESLIVVLIVVLIDKLIVISQKLYENYMFTLFMIASL